jgi:hypothetical protein
MAIKTTQGLDRWLQPLASLRLAVVLLGLLAAVLAAATFYESSAGSDAAQRHVYQAVWFDLLLLLLGVNVAAAAIIRWPWRLKMVGFVITHVAILAILGGCLTTNWLGVTGRVVLSEGQQDTKVIQDGWVIQAAGHGMGSRGPAAQITIDQPPRVDKTIAFESGGQSYTLKILQYLPNAEPQTLLVEGTDKDPAAILIELKQPSPAGMGDEMPPSQQWLLVDDKTQWAINTPGFSLVAASQYTPPVESAAAGPAKGTLVAAIDGHDYEVDVEKALTEPVPVADGKATLRVINYYEHASVGMAGKIQDDPARPVNPAVILELTSDGKTETRKIFAKFGDISAMHGGPKEQTIKLSLRHSGAAKGGMKVVIVPSQDKWVLHEDNGQKLLQQTDLQPDTAVTLKGMPVALTIKTSLPHAKPAKQVVAVPLSKGASPQPALEVEVTGPKGQYRDWLAWSQSATFVMGPNALRLTLQSRQYPLPFAIKLDRFELETYAGSQMPAMYRSEVTVVDTQDRERLSKTIEMNQPLEYKGWSFFQSSYYTSGGHNVSVLAASRDPGKPIVYIGAILLVLGTAILTFQRLKAQMPSNARSAPAAQTDVKKKAPVETKHA